MYKDLAQYTKDSKIKETIKTKPTTNFIKQNNPTNQHKTIGVVIPIYNVAEYLRECLDSVINQTYKNLSIVLVNDGSTDKNESLNIAKEYVSKDSRFILIDKENGGQSTARNVGIEWFKHKYQTKLDSVESNEFIKNEKSSKAIESNTLQTSFLADKTNEAIHKIESKQKDSINTMKTKSLNNPINQDSIHTEFTNTTQIKLDSINTESLNNKTNTTNQNNKNTINDNSHNYGGGGNY